MWHYNNNLYEKLSELRKVNRLSSTKMRFLLKTNQIILINHIERLPYERHETSIQGVHSISWGIDKKHRFNEYAKRKSDKGVTIIPVDYAQFKDMTDYVESSIKLSLKQVFTDGITLKGHTIKL